MPSMLYGDALNEYCVSIFRENNRLHRDAIMRTATREQARVFADACRQHIRRIFRFPQRTPLNPCVTGAHAYPGFTVETLYFFSRPGYPVTANFYLPEHVAGKLPGVLFLCGHADEGKASETYRSCCISLAMKGFAVLCLDPVEQGERHQLRQVEGAKADLCGNHNLMGKKLALLDDWLGAWRAWDGVRGLDYLESRPEVDAARLCVTGNSGGGTLTTWVAAVDDRPVAVAPSCYITSWRRNIENELPADIEQMPPDALLGKSSPLEMADFLLAQAPRHVLILGQANDIFDARGTRETFEEVRHVNDLLGGRTELFIGPTDHGYSIENREAMYAFLTKYVLGKEDGKEPAHVMPPAEETYAVGGSVANIPGNRWLWELTAEETARQQRPATQWRTKAELAALLQKALRIPAPAEPYTRGLRLLPVGNRIYASRWILETGIPYGQIADTTLGLPGKCFPLAVLLQFSRRAWHHLGIAGKRVRLYLPDQDSSTELRERPLREDEEPLFGLDVRGIGEMMAAGTDQPLQRNFLAPYEADYHYASLGIFCGSSLPAGKCFDILCAIETLHAAGAQGITMEARGLAAVPALLAAVITPRQVTLELHDAPGSLAELAMAPLTTYPLSCLPPALLTLTDLPELKHAIGL